MTTETLERPTEESGQIEMTVLVSEYGLPTLKSLLPDVEWQAGDTKLIWDKNKSEEVEAAEATFKKLTAKGYAAYEVEGEEGDKGKVVKTFNPKAERLILALPMVGG